MHASAPESSRDRVCAYLNDRTMFVKRLQRRITEFTECEFMSVNYEFDQCPIQSNSGIDAPSKCYNASQVFSTHSLTEIS